MNIKEVKDIKVKFRFDGVYYNYSKYGYFNNEITEAKNKNDALNHFRKRARDKLKLENNSKIELVGNLIVIYSENIEIYKIDDRTNTINLINSPYNDDWENKFKKSKNQINYNGEWLYIEQAKYYDLLPKENIPAYILTYQNGETERIYRELTIQKECGADYILYNEEVFWYNEDSNSFWNGQPYNSDKISQFIN